MPGCQCYSVDLVTSTVAGGNASVAALYRACLSFLEGSDFRAISSISSIGPELASTAADVNG